MAPPRRYCEVEGCGRPRFGQGYCNAHYKRWRKTGDPGPADIRGAAGTCTVPGCDRRHRARGLCHAHWVRYRETGEWPTTPITPVASPLRLEKCLRPYCDLPGNTQGYCRRHFARQKVFHSYGMSGWDEFDRMWDACGGKCEICQRTLAIDSRITHVDHDHVAIYARGVLCGPCNQMLGNAQEQVDTLMAAVRYLERTKR